MTKQETLKVGQDRSDDVKRQSIKKNERMPFVAMWIDLEIILLSEGSQKEKDKHHMISLTCGI